MTLPTITLDEFMSWNPCYSRRRVEVLAAGRESMNALEILALDIPAMDRLWAVLREELIPAHILHEFACWCAEEALKLVENPDPRSLEAIRIKRLWIKGEATDEELHAAWSAAWSAAYSPTRTAAHSAAWSAAWSAAEDAEESAARSAIWSAARSVARDSQVEMLIQLLQEYVEQNAP